MKFNLNELNVDEINTILTGLMELPAKFSVNLMAKIRQQVDEQQRESSPAVDGSTSAPTIN